MKYKIKRGSYTRQEGDKGFVRYPVGATVEMTDKQADAYGRNRLLAGGGVDMPEAKPAAEAVTFADKGKAADKDKAGGKGKAKAD